MPRQKRHSGYGPSHAAGLAFIIVALIALGLLNFAAPAGAAHPQRPEFVGIRVGFSNGYKVGHWTPLEVVVRGGTQPMTGTVALTVADGDDSSTTVTSGRAYQLLPGVDTPVLLYVKPGHADGPFSAAFFRSKDEGGGIVARHTFEVRNPADELHPGPAYLASQELIVSVGPATGVSDALTLMNRDVGLEDETVLVELPDAQQLPTRWYGYDGVSWLVLSTSQPELFLAFSETSAQLSALRQWVELGGRILLCVGSRANEMLAPGAPFAGFAPGKFERTVPLRQLRALEAYINASDPLDLAALGRGDARLDVPQLGGVRGKVEVQEGDGLPLIVRSPYGFGEVVFVAVDLDRPPFAGWRHRGRLVSELLGGPLLVPKQQQQQQHVAGYSDLAGALRAGLERFTGVKIAPFWVVALLVIGYILLIGPVDFLLVKKVFRRTELTWITFPTIVVAVSLGAYFLANWMKGDKLLVNQVDLVDVDLTGSTAPPPGTEDGSNAGAPRPGLVRGTTWTNVFSPRMRTYDVAVAPRLPDGTVPEQSERLVSWMGLPGSGLGGLSRRTPAPTLFGSSYSYAPKLDVLLGVPIQQWDSKSFTARWSARAEGLVEQLHADLAAGGRDTLEGTLTNGFDMPLDDALLAFRTTLYRLGTLEPGAPIEINPGSGANLRSRLIDRSAAQLPANTIQQWNVGNMQVPNVILEMMFYRAVDGAGSTGLLNRYQSFVDLSRHLNLDQAILVARGRHAATDLELDGQTPSSPNNQHWIYYRFLLPVRKGPPAS